MNHSRVHVIHGVVMRKNAGLICHRSFEDYELFEKHLAGRPDPYVSISEALDGKGDALTIDDATVAGKRAAELARRHGHAVTLFVNPYNVIQQKTYFFHRLNAIVEAIVVRGVRFEDVYFPLATFQQKIILRKYAKYRLHQMSSELARSGFLDQLEEQAGLANPPLPEHLATLSFDDLVQLDRLGVAIENHGWTHAYYGPFTEQEIQLEMQDASEWLDSHGWGRECSFAVPFGDVFPPRGSTFLDCASWFTLAPSFPPGPIGQKVWRHFSVWNRTLLELQ
jgi:peptidoglycan/xylan/chitin deacetylase (PgdA/CDA1 family)